VFLPAMRCERELRSGRARQEEDGQQPHGTHLASVPLCQ
jgi:hypothetical protein